VPPRHVVTVDERAPMPPIGADMGGPKGSGARDVSRVTIEEITDCRRQREDASALDNVSKVQFGLGLAVCLVAAALLFFGVIESGIAAVVGIIGIGLIAASGRQRHET